MSKKTQLSPLLTRLKNLCDTYHEDFHSYAQLLEKGEANIDELEEYFRESNVPFKGSNDSHSDSENYPFAR